MEIGYPLCAKKYTTLQGFSVDTTQNSLPHFMRLKKSVTPLTKQTSDPDNFALETKISNRKYGSFT